MTIRNTLISKFKRKRKSVTDDAEVAIMKAKFGAPGKGGRPRKRFVDDVVAENVNGQSMPAAKTAYKDVSMLASIASD